MLKKGAFVLIVLLFCLNIAMSVQIIRCGAKNLEWKCLFDDLCTCEIDSCDNGNLIIFYKDITRPICYPKIKDGFVTIDLVSCEVAEEQINVVAICNEEQSDSKKINITFERPSACVWNETTNSCTKNTDPFAESCDSGYSCQEENGNCICKKIITTLPVYTTKVFTTIKQTTTTYETTVTQTTLNRLLSCPYECCDGISGYEDLLCDEGYVCCPDKNDNYYCKKGDSCEEKRASGSGGWIVILLIVVLLIIGGAVYYFSKSKISLQDKYRF